MASKSQAKPAVKAQIQDMTVAERPALPTHQPSSKSVQATLLTLTGLTATLAGLALTVAPRLSWKAAKIMVGFDYLGVHGGALVMGGLMLIGVAMVLRQVTHSRAVLAQSGEDTSLLESVAADVLQVGTVLEGLVSSISDLKHDLQGLHATVSSLPAPAPAPAEQVRAKEGLDSEDAIFRLAASMDKVGARIEERLKSQFTDLTGRLNQVESSIQETAALLEHLETPAAPMPVRPQEVHYQEPDLQQHAAPALSQTSFRPAPTDPKSLGLLDELDDNGVPSPLPAEQPLHFDRANELSLQMPPPAGGRWADPPAAPQGKQQNPLMVNPQMRAALEDLGRRGRAPGR